MPNFVTEDFDDTIEDVMENGGKSKATKQREAQILKIFGDFVQGKNGKTIDELLAMDKKVLEETLMSFFHSFRVMKNGKEELPKKLTAELYKSFIKTIILNKSDAKIDISDRVVFNKFHLFYQG